MRELARDREPEPGTRAVAGEERAKDPLPLLRVDVADAGLGIKRQTMPHIFEPFFTSTDNAQGSGLGLAIARELAERMDGEITLKSRPGVTAFTLTLPSPDGSPE